MHSRKSLTTSKDIWLIVALAVIIRVAFHSTYAPWLNFDSKEYLDTAGTLLTGHFDRFDGVRTPGYPLFLGVIEWMAGSDFSEPLSRDTALAVTIVQSIGGVMSAVIFYLAMIGMGIGRPFALAAAFFFAALATPAIFEMGVMSDALSVFFVVLLLYWLIIAAARIKAARPFYFIAMITGVVAGISALVRLNNLVFILGVIGGIAIFAVIQWLRKRQSLAYVLVKFCFMLGLGTFIPVLACAIFTHHTTGTWNMSSRSSLIMALTAYNLFDRVEPQDKVLGDIVQKHYLRTNTEGHIERKYILQAIPDIIAHAAQMPIPPGPANLKRAYLEQYIGDVSMRLLLNNPTVWLINGITDIPDTFTFSVIDIPRIPTGAYHSVDGKSAIISPSGQRGLNLLGDTEQWLLLGCYLMTYATIIVSGIRSLRMPGDSSILDAMVPFALATSAIVSMVSSCFLGLYVPRYGMSFYAILIASAAWLCPHRKQQHTS